MKTKVTLKQLQAIAGKENIYVAGYCELQNLLSWFEPQFYNCGIYGWNWDGYLFDGFIIITGYRNLNGISIPYEICQHYNTSSKTKQAAAKKVKNMIKRVKENNK